MPAILEDLAARELDDLYQAALFLSAGHRDEAQDLVLETMTRAVDSFRGLAGDVDASRWLHALLVRQFLRGSSSSASGRARRTTPRSTIAVASPSAFDTPEAAALCYAAGAVPPRARAALWLVALRRWRYGDAAEAMRTSIDELRELLLHRDAFAAEAMRQAGGRRGASGTTAS